MTQEEVGKPFVERYPIFTTERWSNLHFQEEQDYVLARLRRHNQILHGWGVVEGLDVNLETSRGGDRVSIAPGYALDCAGNEIQVLKPVSLPLAERDNDSEIYLCIEYLEERVRGDPDDDGAPSEFVSTREGFEVSLLGDDPCARHTPGQTPWRGCGERHPLSLARLVFSRIRWRIDLHFTPHWLER